jgi:nicotinamidase/pyrazinamidase
MKTALLLVDIQKDFLPGGALEVPDGDAVVPVANWLVDHFPLVVASRDWHPPDHLSFASQHEGKSPGDVVTVDGVEQTLWPDHCVQDTPGAELAPGLRVDAVSHVVDKGVDRRIDGYSAFFDNAQQRSTGLGAYLRNRESEAVVLVGLALDVCVKATALDAVRLGFATTLVEDGTRAVNLSPDDGKQALKELRQAGVRVVDAETLLTF